MTYSCYVVGECLTSNSAQFTWEFLGAKPMNKNVPILHIDDDPQVLLIIAARLKKFGYIVEGLQDGLRWNEAIETTNAGIIILDYDLATIDGIEILKQIKAAYPDRRIIMLTGVASRDLFAEASKLGADYCFSKTSLHIEELADAIKTLAFQRLHWSTNLSDTTLSPSKSNTSRSETNIISNPARPPKSIQHAVEYLCIDGFCGYLLETARVSSADVLRVTRLIDEQTPKLGQLALQLGKLKMKQIFAILHEQSVTGELFGQIALQLKLLNHADLNDLLILQRRQRPKFYELVVELQILTQAELKEYREEYEQVNRVHSVVDAPRILNVNMAGVA
jgi:DNA-binding NarL/FixJ family response regulator